MTINAATSSTHNSAPRQQSAVERRLADLEAQLAQLRHDLASEVRTRRLVVTDETGFERIETWTLRESGGIRVNSRTPDRDDDHPTFIDISASEEELPSFVAVNLFVDGECVEAVTSAEHEAEGA